MTSEDSGSGKRNHNAAVPAVVDRATFQAELDALRVREKAHTRAGDAIAAARRRLPMVEVDSTIELIGPDGPVTLLDVFEGRRQLIAYYFMWEAGAPAAEQCEGCTFYTTQVGELSYLHSRDVTYATLCQGPFAESVRYRDFMGWDDAVVLSPTRVARHAPDRAPGRHVSPGVLPAGGDRVFETYWTNGRGVEAMDNNYAADGPDRVRTPGGVGGLAGWLAAAIGAQSPDLAQQRTPDRPVVPPAGRALGRAELDAL